MELDGWRYLRDSAPAVRISTDRKGHFSADWVSFPPMDKGEKKWWAHLHLNVQPHAMMATPPGAIADRGGPLARKRYLLGCTAVGGQYSLIPKREVESAAKRNGIIHCAHCGAAFRVASEGRNDPIRRRRPIIARPQSGGGQRLRPLALDELAVLYARRRPPEGIIDAGG